MLARNNVACEDNIYSTYGCKDQIAISIFNTPFYFASFNRGERESPSGESPPLRGCRAAARNRVPLGSRVAEAKGASPLGTPPPGGRFCWHPTWSCAVEGSTDNFSWPHMPNVSSPVCLSFHSLSDALFLIFVFPFLLSKKLSNEITFCYKATQCLLITWGAPVWKCMPV